MSKRDAPHNVTVPAPEKQTGSGRRFGDPTIRKATLLPGKASKSEFSPEPLVISKPMSEILSQIIELGAAGLLCLLAERLELAARSLQDR